MSQGGSDGCHARAVRTAPTPAPRPFRPTPEHDPAVDPARTPTDTGPRVTCVRGTCDRRAGPNLMEDYAQVSSAAPERLAVPVYLGPALPRWQPRSVDDVRAAISDGTLGERHWLDVKAEVGNTDSTKKGLAKDLAAFANDGGALLIGVRENKEAAALAAAPILLDGLAETVDQIARSRCDPPVYVVCHPLPAPAEADGKARGVLLIEVPPSPSAPHMADGRYYGRGDTTNHQLTDADVARLHAVRNARQVTAAQLIATEAGRDPVAADLRELSHLYVVAQPVASPPDLVTDLIGSPDLDQMVVAVPAGCPAAGNAAAPSWSTLTFRAEPRAMGSGFSSHGLVARQFQPELAAATEKTLLDVEIQDDGRVSLFCGRGSNIRGDSQYVADAAVVSLTRAVVTFAGRLGARTGYAGRWTLAIGVDDLTGKVSSAALNTIRLGPDYSPFTAESYVRGTEAVTVELLDQPGAVTRRLTDRLLRALGRSQDQNINKLLTDLAPPGPS